MTSQFRMSLGLQVPKNRTNQDPNYADSGSFQNLTTITLRYPQLTGKLNDLWSKKEREMMTTAVVPINLGGRFRRTVAAKELYTGRPVDSSCVRRIKIDPRVNHLPALCELKPFFEESAYMTRGLDETRKRLCRLWARIGWSINATWEHLQNGRCVNRVAIELYNVLVRYKGFLIGVLNCLKPNTQLASQWRSMQPIEEIRWWETHVGSMNEKTEDLVARRGRSIARSLVYNLFLIDVRGPMRFYPNMSGPRCYVESKDGKRLLLDAEDSDMVICEDQVISLSRNGRPSHLPGGSKTHNWLRTFSTI